MSFITSLVPSFNRPAAGVSAPADDRDLGLIVKPAFELSETSECFALTVNLPGVTRDGLEFQADAETLTLTGRRAWKKPDAWTALHRETDDAAFRLALSHDNAVNLDKIQADLRDGILRVVLPKAESIKPRKITVG